MSSTTPQTAPVRARAKGRRAGAFRIALTGARTFLGERLVAAMEADPRCEHVLVMDIARPLAAGPKTRFARVDLTNPSADGQMAKLLIDDGIDVLCHLAFLSFPSHSRSWAHELEAIGTLYVMNAAASARVPKVVMASTTMTYGAHHDNPAYLTEAHPLRGVRSSRWVKDKIAAEIELARLASDCPGMTTTALRFATFLGPTQRSFFGRLLARPVQVRLMGFDPLMQFLHEEDAVRALLHAVEHDRPGAFNIAGEGVLYYSQVVALGGRIPLPIPHVLAGPSTHALWNLQLVDIPGPFLNYLRFGWCADTRRMREVFGFTPEWTSRDALAAFYASVARDGIRSEQDGVGRVHGQPRTVA